MNLFEQIKEHALRAEQMLDTLTVVQREITALIDEINGKLGPIVSLFNAPQAAVLAAAEKTTRRGRKSKAPRAVSNDTNGEGPKSRRTKKGAAFGKYDVEEVLALGGGATRDVIAERIKHRIGAALTLEQIKLKLSQILSPCNAKGLFVRGPDGSYALASKPTTRKKRQAKVATAKGGAKSKSSRRSKAPDGDGHAFTGSRRAELEQVMVERLEGQTKSAGQLANECAPLFPLADKRAVSDAICEILVEDKGRRFVGTPAGDWRLA
jgi:hypothetical protein